jgi:hypothetical protein
VRRAAPVDLRRLTAVIYDFRRETADPEHYANAERAKAGRVFVDGQPIEHAYFIDTEASVVLAYYWPITIDPDTGQPEFRRWTGTVEVIETSPA